MLSPTKGHRLVQEYRDPARLRAAIPHNENLTHLPRLPFIGSLGYAELVSILRRRSRFYSRAERIVIDQLATYLDYKRHRATRRPLPTVNEGPEGP